MLTQSRLKELYNYDPKTGLFYRKVSIRGFAKGSKVGYTGKRGYCEIGVDGKHYQALMECQEITEFQIYEMLIKNKIVKIKKKRTKIAKPDF